MTPSYTVIIGDALVVLSAMAAGSVECVITDIPYNEVNDRDTSDGEGMRDLRKGAADAALVDVPLLVDALVRVGAGSFYVFCGYAQISPLVNAFRRHVLSVRVGGWHKSDPPPLVGEHLWLSAFEACVFARKAGSYFARHCKPPIWHGPIERNIDWHPTPKPEWLMRELVTASCPPRGTVLDPFMGSGTVGVAAMTTGRDFIGCELNAEWARRAERRIADAPLPLLLD